MTEIQELDLPALRDAWRLHYRRPRPGSSAVTCCCAASPISSRNRSTEGSPRRRGGGSGPWPRPSRSTGRVAPDNGAKVRPGTRLVREWRGRTHVVTATESGFDYDGEAYGSLTAIAQRITGAHWSGPASSACGLQARAHRRRSMAERRKPPRARSPATVGCAIYTRKSSEEGLEQDFNSLQAQREACEAYIASQKHEGWIVLPTFYDDGGVSGATLQRPALQRLLADVEVGRIDTIVVYKVDRLTRTLSDFARLVEIFDRKAVSFVSVTQQFNTTTSMGRLTLNVLLSFAQFEREVTANVSATRSPPRRGRGCGWAATRPWATM